MNFTSVLGRAYRRVRRIVRGNVHALPEQLEMVWPGVPLPAVPPVPSGFSLRNFVPDDRKAYLKLMRKTFGHEHPLDYWSEHVLPGGFFVVVDERSAAIASTCMASHHPSARHPEGGNLGWLATDPAYAGRGLGTIASVAVTRRLVAAGYSRPYLTTDDFRHAAIRLYLKMGWIPYVFNEATADRWKVVLGSIFPGDVEAVVTYLDAKASSSRKIGDGDYRGA